jgi:hypothetical protein
MQKRLFKRGPLTLTALAITTTAAAPAAKAALVLTLSEPGFAPATYTDNTNTAVSDFSGSPIPYGTFTTDIVVGSSNLNYPGQTPPSNAILQIQSLQVVSTNGAGHTLTISLTETGYGFPGGAGSREYMDSSLGGTLSPSSAGDTVTFQSTATATSGVAATNVSSGLQSFTPADGNLGRTLGFSEPDANTSWINGGSFDLQNVTTVTLFQVGESANLSGTTTVSLTPIVGVPEPTATALGAIAAAGGLLARRTRRSRLPRS